MVGETDPSPNSDNPEWAEVGPRGGTGPSLGGQGGLPGGGGK